MNTLGNIRTTTVGVNPSLSFAAYSAGWGKLGNYLRMHHWALTELAYQ